VIVHPSAPNDFWPRPVSADTLTLLDRLNLSVSYCREDSSMDGVLFMINAMSPRRTTLVNGEGQRVDIDYLLAHDRDEKVINAFACRINQSYVCAVHEGFYIATMDLAYGVFPDPSFLPEVGDVCRLTPPTADLELGRRVTSAASLHAIVPNCPRRKQVADLLIVLMNTVAMLHEEGHVVLGHAGFLAAQAQGLWSERTAFNYAARSPLFSQLLEQNADFYALMALFSNGWVEIITNNFAETCDVDSRQLMTLCWLASALVGGIIFFTDPIRCYRPGILRQWGSHIPSFFRVRELALPTTVLNALMDEKHLFRWIEDILNSFLDAHAELNGLAERVEQFTVFAEQLPPELDEVAHRWNSDATALASAMNEGELKPIVEQLQGFRLTTRTRSGRL
jgi:hypothetical protein